MPKPRRRVKSKTEPIFEIGTDNIFVDLGFSEDEAVSLLARSELAMEIRNIIEEKGWTQHRAAKEMGVAQPRIAEIMKMRLEHYSIDQLLKYLNKLGRRVSFVIEKKNRVA
jgi:predicted XRE-type DNA-binding protein